MKSRNDKIDEDINKKDGVVTKEDKAIPRPKKYVITVTNLALRNAPNGEIIGIAEAGLTLITEIQDGFGKLADNSGWVSMQYTRKVD